MQFAIGVLVLECYVAKHNHGPLGVKGPLSRKKYVIKGKI
jgi:hypothetical protein